MMNSRRVKTSRAAAAICNNRVKKAYIKGFNDCKQGKFDPKSVTEDKRPRINPEED